jgi:hypothetical protein
MKEAYLYIAPYAMYLEPFMFRPDLLLFVSFFSLPALLVVMSPFFKNREITTKSKILVKLSSLSIQFGFVLLIGILLIALLFRPEEKRKIRIDWFAYQGRWQALIKASKEMKTYDRGVNFNLNRALYHTGQLLDQMFAYPQLIGPDGLFINRILASQIAIPASDLYFDLGHIHAAQAMAFEAQTKFKHNPRILKRLVLIGMIENKPVFARKFIDLLKTSLIFRKWAKQHEAYLNDPSLIKSNPQVQNKRMLRPQKDFFINNKFPTSDLNRIFMENPKNRMAFEYLMAYYLLDCKLGSLEKYLKHYRKPDRQDIPRHVEEAILLMKVMNPGRIDIQEYRIGRRTLQRFQQFHQILQQHAGNEQSAKAALTQHFGDTYWYYVRYLNPKETKWQLRKQKVNEDIL